MRTDVKIGMVVGVFVVLAAIVWLASRNPDVTPTVQKIVNQEKTPATTPPPAQPATQQPPKIKVLKPVEVPKVTETTQAPPVPETPAVKEFQEPPQPAPQPAPEPEIRQPRYHTVLKGDTLSIIAESYYGHSKHWKVIQQANKELVLNPNYLEVGWKLRIPYPDEVTGQSSTAP